MVMGLFALSFYFGYRDKLKKEEVEQHLFEMELRECEVDMDLAEVRSDILRLTMKYEPERLLQASREVEDTTGEDRGLHTQQSTMFSPSKPTPRFALGRQRRLSLADGYSNDTSAATTSFESALYPCYVLPLTHLMTMTTLPAHEDALDLDVLEVLTTRSRAPCSAFAYFVSQNWESFGTSPHPDNQRSTKLNWLKNIRTHLGITANLPELWIWWDLVSVPQRNAKEQKLAIASLCFFASVCSRFLPLVRDEHAWTSLYQEDIASPDYPTAGTLGTYINRGWCRLEVLAGLAPKRFASGSWRPGPRNMRFRFHQDPNSAGVGPLMTASLIRNPISGNFTVDTDRDVIKPVLTQIAQRYAEYAASGSTSWSATVDVHKRPAWLKALAGVDEGAIESPAAALGLVVLEYSRSTTQDEPGVIEAIEISTRSAAPPVNDTAVDVTVTTHEGESEGDEVDNSADNEWSLGGVVLTCS